MSPSEVKKREMLSDIAARIPYGIRVWYMGKDYNVVGIYKDKLMLEADDGSSKQVDVLEVTVYLVCPTYIRSKEDKDTLIKSVLGMEDTKGFCISDWTLGFHRDDGASINFEPNTVKDYCKWFFYNQVDMWTFTNNNRLDIKDYKISVIPKDY